MDNQTSVVTPTQQSPAPMVPPPAAPARQGGKHPALLGLLLLLALVAGALGFLYYQTNSSLKNKSQELSKAYQTVEQFQAALDNNPVQQEKNFILQNNTAELSRRLCSAKPLLMSDVHLTDNFAVFRYLCANIDFEVPIRVAALKKLPDGSYEFTYGASALTPNDLPGYIFDDDPDFFGTYYGVSRY